MTKIKITSIPIFIKEYIRTNVKDLKYFCDRAIDILNKKYYEHYISGYRDIFKARISDDNEENRFVIDIFFSFFVEKLEVLESGIILYEKELGIENSMYNELFELEYEDEYGDKEKFKAMLEEYNNNECTISFMKI